MSAQRLYTWDDLTEFPEELRTELVDGVLYLDGSPHQAGEPLMTPSPRARHQEIAGRIHVAIANHLSTIGGARIFYELDVVFDDRNTARPDLVLVTDDQRDLVRGHIHGTPRLVIEVLSDPRLDRVVKRALYERFGVAEYWIVDHDADRVEVYRLEDAAYGKPTLLEPGERLATPLLPGLEIDLATLFRR